VSLLPVNVYVADSDEEPIAGVVIKVYSEDGTSLITEATSDADGLIALLLEEETTFEIRLFKFAYTFANPLHIEILTAGINRFDVLGTDLADPVPTDARLCTAFGYFRDVTGRPLRGARLTFVPKFLPFLLEGAAVLTGHVTVTTDETGYAKVDLVRFGIYDCTIHAKEDYLRCCKVPDQPNVDLPDLLLPLVYEITFDPAVPTTYVAGEEDTVVTPTIKLTDGSEGTFSDVQWSSSDSDVLAVIPSGAGTLTLRPLAAGTAEIRAVRADNSIIRIPDPGITGVPITAVVT